MSARSAQAVLIAIGVVLPAVTRAEVPWFESYERGLKAIHSRQWSIAEKELRAALQTGPRPGRHVRTYGVRFIDYIPSYHLAVVYSNQGRHREALEELQRLEASGLIGPGDPEFEQMASIRNKAAQQAAAPIAPPTPPPTPTPEATARAQPRSEGETLIQFARDLVDQGHLAEAAKALESVRAREPDNPALAPLAETIARKQAEVTARADQAVVAELEMYLKSARQLLKQKKYAEARAMVEKLRAAGRVDPRLREILAQADLGERQLAAASALEQEQLALRAFYEGRYQAAAVALEALARTERRKARPLFYLACSHSALAFLDGKAGEPLLHRARDEFAEVARLGSIDSLDRKWISPRIMRVFEEARGR